MHVQSCSVLLIYGYCFFFFAVLTAPSSLRKLPIVVIQKFCYHIPQRNNVTLLRVFSIKTVSQAIESLERLVPVVDV